MANDNNKKKVNQTEKQEAKIKPPYVLEGTASTINHADFAAIVTISLTWTEDKTINVKEFLKFQ